MQLPHNKLKKLEVEAPLLVDWPKSKAGFAAGLALLEVVQQTLIWTQLSQQLPPMWMDPIEAWMSWNEIGCSLCSHVDVPAVCPYTFWSVSKVTITSATCT
jgi:hypothetical protein